MSEKFRAKIKVEIINDILIRIYADNVEIINDILIRIYADNLESCLPDIRSIKGVVSAGIMPGRISAIIDPRYDTKEIAEEIETLLLAEVPDVFKENDNDA